MLIVDVIAESGTRAAAHVLLEKFKANEITSTRASSVFMTFTNTIVEPELFKDVMVRKKKTMNYLWKTISIVKIEY